MYVHYFVHAQDDPSYEPLVCGLMNLESQLNKVSNLVMGSHMNHQPLHRSAQLSGYVSRTKTNTKTTQLPIRGQKGHKENGIASGRDGMPRFD